MVVSFSVEGIQEVKNNVDNFSRLSKEEWEETGERWIGEIDVWPDLSPALFDGGNQPIAIYTRALGKVGGEEGIKDICREILAEREAE